MALADWTDLEHRRVDTTTHPELIDALLDAASASVTDAAGGHIAPVTESTITLPGGCGQWLDLPVYAPRAVTGVLLDEVPVTGWRMVGGSLWRAAGWHVGWAGDAPSVVTVTLTHGLDRAPADVVDLVCSLVAAGLAEAEDGYDPQRKVSYVRIDDYGYGLRQGTNEVVSPMLLPEGTRQWLRARFTGGVHVSRPRG